ncbi:hypothetical protein CDAR_275541 [Caerostris darwini]|uniref:Uncharacterized protein n=1 Tax=Caerostris darwini TaxID=1538125 RepID=A0AAV4UMN5_9ARAC|nr:hypothetical protein CDAR_275541 [Caerostris darwini]
MAAGGKSEIGRRLSQMQEKDRGFLELIRTRVELLVLLQTQLTYPKRNKGFLVAKNSYSVVVPLFSYDYDHHNELLFFIHLKGSALRSHPIRKTPVGKPIDDPTIVWDLKSELSFEKSQISTD